MIIPRYARYKYVNQKVFEFIKKEHINSFPVNMLEIIEKNKWGLIPYSEMQQQFNCDIQTVITCLKSKDGYTQYNGNNFTIAYNDVTMPRDRISFTLAHEVGHIFLNHLTDFEKTLLYRSNLSEDENRVLENEANAFARNLLAPSALVNSLKRKDKNEIINIFGLSYKATNTRMDLLQADMSYDKSLNLYQEIISHFTNFMYKKHCLVCDYFFIDNKASYCPICGSNEFEWEVSNVIYDDGYKLDKNHKAVICPKCKNEEMTEEGEYCHICGSSMINKCSNSENMDWQYGERIYIREKCDELAQGNARYCIKCGSKTTFFENDFLCDYTEYTGENLLTEKSNSFFDDDYVFAPINEEDIPF